MIPVVENPRKIDQNEASQYWESMKFAKSLHLISFARQLCMKLYAFHASLALSCIAYNIELAKQVPMQYLDSDQDGVVDDPNLAQTMANSEERGKLGLAVLKCRGSIGSGQLKDSWFGITRTYGQSSLNDDSSDDADPSQFQKVTLEECHHGIYHGLKYTYPEVFGPYSGTELYEAVQDLKGDCSDAAHCVEDLNTCDHYDCTTEDGGDSYNCQFLPDSHHRGRGR